MKKILLICMAVLLVFAGCSNKGEPNTIKDGKSLQDVIDAVDLKFKEKYDPDDEAEYDVKSVPNGVAIDQQRLSDFFDIAPEDVAEMAGWYSMMILNSHTFIGIRATDGKIDNVLKGLEKYKTDLANQYEFYNVNGSYNRVLDGEIYQKGDYAFLIIVGLSSGKGEDITYDFVGDVAMTKATIDEMFH